MIMKHLKVAQKHNSGITLFINISSDAAIGRCKIIILEELENETLKEISSKKAYIIANPFDKNGGCYYDGEYQGNFHEIIEKIIFYI